MDVCLHIFDELLRSDHVKYTFTGRDGTFMIYTFLKNDNVSPLDTLAQINLMANKSGISDFWMKKSTFTDEKFNDIYVFRAIDIEKINMSRAEPEIELYYDFWSKYDKLGLSVG